MIQIKCGNCKVIMSLDEATFAQKRHYEDCRCINCNKFVPREFFSFLLKLINKEHFNGWEIGTFFKNEDHLYPQ